MMEVKSLLLEEVRTRLYGRLKDTASSIVREIIQKEIAHRVRHQVRRICHVLRPAIVSEIPCSTARAADPSDDAGRGDTLQAPDHGSAS